MAALGSILATEASNSVVSHLTRTPLAGRAHTLAQAASNGSIAGALHTVPAHLRGVAAGAARVGYIDGFNSVLLIGAIVALAASVLTFILIRQRDFVDVTHPEAGGEQAPAGADARRVGAATG